MPTVSDRYPVEIEPITILQNRWYNSLSTHLNLDRSLFQISYPLAPIIHSTQELWANSTGAVFMFDSSMTDDNVTDTWTAGNNNGLFGLWNGNDSKSSLSRHARRKTMRRRCDPAWPR
jgi:hypothetical protein